MNTAQKYVGKGSYAKALEQTVENAAQTSPKADNRQTDQPPLFTVAAFLTQYPDLIGIDPIDLANALTQRLRQTPAHYQNVLDGISLLRGFLPMYSPPAHFALLLCEGQITGLLYLPTLAFPYEEPDTITHEQGLVTTAGLDLRQLMKTAMSSNATSLLLATTRLDEQYLFETEELSEINLIQKGLELFGIELLDWILLYPDANMSWAWAENDEEGLSYGVTIELSKRWRAAGFNRTSKRAARMEELIKVTTDGQGSSVVSARELHAFLEIKSRFNDWIKNRIIKYGFLEERDYVTLTKNLVSGGIATDYALTLGMAKELAMVEVNAKGKQAWQYFIEREELARKLLEQQQAPAQLSTDQVLLQLMAQSNQLLANQQQQLDQLREEVSQIMQGRRPAPRHPGQQLRIKGIGPAPQQPGLRTMINRKIEEYCDRFGYDRRETWNYLYKRLFEVYGINTHRLVKIGRENMLDTLERYGYLDRLYTLIMAELNYSEE